MLNSKNISNQNVKSRLLSGKKIIIAIIVILMSVITQTTFAHEHHKDTTQMSASEKQTDALMQKEMAEHQQIEAVNAFPNYHPLVVHFPIVLLLMATVFQLLSFFYFKREFSIATLILLSLGFISAWLASGPFHAMPGELTGQAKEIFQTHEQMASLTWWFSLVALLLKIVSHFFYQRKLWMESLIALLLIASVVTVSIAGHHGAMLVHMEGIGPMGKYLDTYHIDVIKEEHKPEFAPTTKIETENTESKPEEQEEDHHVGEIGKGPHGGTIEEADPYHMEIVADGNDLVFYLLDGDAKPFDMKEVTGSVKIQYADKKQNTIELMMMDGKLTAMLAQNGQRFAAVCTLNKDGKVYYGQFRSIKDLPASK